MLLPFSWLAHSPGDFLLLARLQADGPQAPFGAGQAAAQADLLGVEPDLFARNLDGRHVARQSSAADSGRPSPRLPRRSCRPPCRAPRPSDRRCRRVSSLVGRAPGCACSAPAAAAASARRARRCWPRSSFSASRNSAICAWRRSIRFASGHQSRGTVRSAPAGTDIRW